MRSRWRQEDLRLRMSEVIKERVFVRNESLVLLMYGA